MLRQVMIAHFANRACTLQITTLVVLSLSAFALNAQVQLPQIIQLPDQDFVYAWGDNASVDKRNRPDFTVHGVERSFRCTLTGAFKPGSHMRDYYSLREFEQSLSTTIYFIQEATARLNDLYLQNELDWAIMDCIIPQSVEDEDKRQEKVDKAVERAEKQRDRRRAKEERANE
jgi:hypothetical protein